MRDDFELLRDWREGEVEAGRELFGRHFGGVYRFFRNKVHDAAEDLTQQTFMAIVKGKDQFRGDASFRTYLFTVARKRLYSYLRDVGRRGEPVEFHSASVADLGLSPSRLVVAREEQHLLLRALRQLPIDMQLALELFYWEDLTVVEMATVLDVPVGTVKSRLQRARVRLDGLIGQLSESDALHRSTIDNFERWVRDLQAHMGPAANAESADD